MEISDGVTEEIIALAKRAREIDHELHEPPGSFYREWDDLKPGMQKMYCDFAVAYSKAYRELFPRVSD